METNWNSYYPNGVFCGVDLFDWQGIWKISYPNGVFGMQNVPKVSLQDRVEPLKPHLHLRAGASVGTVRNIS